MREYTVLNKGYIKLLDVQGSDSFIAETARISTASNKKDGNKTIGNMLSYDPPHMSPFEFAGIVFEIKAPIFTLRQIMRQRTFKYMEQSGRYTNFDPDFFEVNKTDYVHLFAEAIEENNKEGYFKYEQALNYGVKKELARLSLPPTLYSTVKIKADLRNLLNFLNLRLRKSTQELTREYAQVLKLIVIEHFPITWKHFENQVLNSVRLSFEEKQEIVKILESHPDFIEGSFLSDKLIEKLLFKDKD